MVPVMVQIEVVVLGDGRLEIGLVKILAAGWKQEDGPGVRDEIKGSTLKRVKCKSSG